MIHSQPASSEGFSSRHGRKAQQRVSNTCTRNKLYCQSATDHCSRKPERRLGKVQQILCNPICRRTEQTTPSLVEVNHKGWGTPNEYFPSGSVPRTRLRSHEIGFTDQNANQHFIRNLSPSFGVETRVWSPSQGCIVKAFKR